MKTRVLLICCALMLRIGTQAQLVYEEKFKDNKNNWYVGENEMANCRIEDGKYIIERKQAGNQAMSIINNCSIDESKDFQIEFYLSQATDTKAAYGVNWGARDQANKFVCYINSDGLLKILKIENGSISGVLVNDKTDAIKRITYTENNICIRKEGNQYKFLINDVLVGTAPYQNLFGNNIGFEIYSQQKIEAHRITVSTGNLPKITGSIPKGINTQNNFTTLYDERFDFFNCNWPQTGNENPNATILVFNGVMRFICKLDDSGIMSSVPIEVSQNEDFIIETMISKTGGSDNSEFGIIWGAINSQTCYEFLVNGNGKYAIWKIKDGIGSEDYKSWGSSEYFNKSNNTNVLDIYKKGLKYEFYINGQFICSEDFKPFFGNQFGIIGFNDINIDVRSFKVFKPAMSKGRK